MKQVYLCEKAEQGREVAKALGISRKIPGGMEGDGVVVTWASGHLLTPYYPHEYNAEWKKFAWETLPINPGKFKYKPRDERAAKQMGFIKKILRDAQSVIIATDPDREGEHIAYLILNDLGWKGPLKRILTPDLSEQGLARSVRNFLPAEQTKPLFFAALARSYADWHVGMNMSRAFTLKLAAPGAPPMSVGRVQTPVLALVVDRENKIKNFKAEDYYEISATVAAAKGNLVMRYAPSVEKRIKDIAQAQKLRDRAQGAQGPIQVKVERKSEKPPSLYNQSLLAQHCNRKFGWTAEETLAVNQKLYDTHHLLTYPRSDCKLLPVDQKDLAPKVISALQGVEELSEPTHHFAANEPILRKSTYGPTSAHHAIVPTEKVPDFSALTSKERDLYLLVARSFLAAHMPDMEYLQTTITMDANGVPLRASGRQITKPGWKAAFPASQTAKDEEDSNDKDPADSQTLPELTDGENGLVQRAEIDAKKTKPPRRYTEATLLAAMENIANEVDDPAAKKILKATTGLGTPATCAKMLETLKKREYVKVIKKEFVPQPSGFSLIEGIRSTAPTYADPIMTARWEQVLKDIEEGGGSELMQKFINGIIKMIANDLGVLREAEMKKMKAKATGTGASKAGFIEGDWKAAIAEGTPLTVKFDDKNKAKKLGARWDAERTTWVAPKGFDLAPFKKAGFLKG